MLNKKLAAFRDIVRDEVEVGRRIQQATKYDSDVMPHDRIMCYTWRADPNKKLQLEKGDHQDRLE